MSAAEVSDAGPGGPAFNVTLIPFSRKGSAALAPEPDLGIVRAVLVQERLVWRNAFNETLERTAEDLFACAARGGAYYDPFPKGADVLSVIIELYFENSPEPHWVELKPPHTVALQHPADAAAIHAFLARKGFILNAEAGLQTVE